MGKAFSYIYTSYLLLKTTFSVDITLIFADEETDAPGS